MPTSPFGTTNYRASPDSKPRQVSQLIEILSPREVPFLKLVGIDGEPGTNPKMEWIEDTLLAETSAMVDDSGGDQVLDSSTTNTIINVTTGDGIHFQAGLVIQCNDVSANTSEQMWVSAVSGDQLTVTRAVGGTTALSTFAATDTIDILGFANNDNTDSPAKGTTEFTQPYNNFQLFDTMFQIGDMMANTEVYGVPQGSEEYELAKAFEELAIKLERQCITGKRGEAGTPTGVPRLMGGLIQYIPDTANTASSSPYGATLADADLTEKDINDMLQNRWAAVGAKNMGKTLLVGAWNKRRINDMFAPYARMERNERTGGVLVDTIDTDFGPIDVVLSLRCPTNRVYLLNMDFVSIHPYTGMAFAHQELAVSGSYTKHQIAGAYSMRVRNARCMGVIYRTSTS